MMARRTPPKVPRPEPAPLTESLTISALAGALERARASAHGAPEAEGAAELSGSAETEILAAFWEGPAARSPLVEELAEAPGDRVVTFLWRDAEAAEVLLFVNRMTDERELGSSLMRRIPRTDVWYLSYRMRADWRASYSFLVHREGERAPWLAADDQVALRAALDRGVADPRNPESIANRAGVRQSVVSLPEAPAQPWYTADSSVLSGAFVWGEAPDGRRVGIYEPAGHEAHWELPLIVVLDGEVWADAQGFTRALDRAIAAGDVAPVRCAFVDSGGTEKRWSDLDDEGGGAEWIAHALVPWWRGQYVTSEVTVAGQSLGGYTAVRTLLEHSAVVTGAIAQSASTWMGDLGDLAADENRAGLRAYVEVGAQEWVLREGNRDLATRLTDAGVDVAFVEFNGGHDYACWRGGLINALHALYPASAHSGVAQTCAGVSENV